MSDILFREQLPPMERWQLEDVATARPARVGGARPASTTTPKPSAAELEALQKQAWDESYARGLEAGRAAGKAEIDRQAARLGKIVEAMVSPLQDIDDQVEEELARLSLAVARQIIRRELAVNPSHVIAAVREALAELPSSTRDIRVVLNPDDAQLVREALSQPSGPATWEIVEDPVIEHGGCRVISPNTTVDASLEARIRAVASRVLGGDRDVDGGVDSGVDSTHQSPPPESP
ncbi:MAG: FliH/SctL family protein [Chromatocurvus sp.]